MHFKSNNFFYLVLAFSISACGGGGGGGDDTPFLPVEQQKVDLDFKSTALLNSAANIALAAPETILIFAQGAALYLGEFAASDGSDLYIPCPGGGADSIKYSDMDSSGSLSSGDSVTIESNHCASEGLQTIETGQIEINLGVLERNVVGQLKTVAFEMRIEGEFVIEIPDQNIETRSSGALFIDYSIQGPSEIVQVRLAGDAPFTSHYLLDEGREGDFTEIYRDLTYFKSHNSITQAFEFSIAHDIESGSLRGAYRCNTPENIVGTAANGEVSGRIVCNANGTFALLANRSLSDRLEFMIRHDGYDRDTVEKANSESLLLNGIQTWFTQVVPLGESAQDVVFLPTTDSIAVLEKAGSGLTLYSANSGKVTSRYPSITGRFLRLSPDGSTLYVVDDGRALLLAVPGMSEVADLEIHFADQPYTDWELNIQELIPLDEQGSMFVLGNGRLQRWQAGTRLYQIGDNAFRPGIMAYSPELEELFLADDAKQFRSYTHEANGDLYNVRSSILSTNIFISQMLIHDESIMGTDGASILSDRGWMIAGSGPLAHMMGSGPHEYLRDFVSRNGLARAKLQHSVYVAGTWPAPQRYQRGQIYRFDSTGNNGLMGGANREPDAMFEIQSMGFSENIGISGLKPAGTIGVIANTTMGLYLIPVASFYPIPEGAPLE